MSHHRPRWVFGLVVIVACNAPSTSAPSSFSLPAPANAPLRTTTASGPFGGAAETVEMRPGSDSAQASARVMVGSASRSILPTFNGSHDYLGFAPGWNDIDPDDPGTFLAQWDQGTIDLGMGEEFGGSDAAWVHDDVRVSALAIAGIEAIAPFGTSVATATTVNRFVQTTSTTSTTTTKPPMTASTAPPRPKTSTDTIVMVSLDVATITSADEADITQLARALIDDDLVADGSLRVIIGATRNQHGPTTSGNVNPEWYSLMVDQVAAAIADAVGRMEPASLVAATGQHSFGVADSSDPVIIDPRLNVLQARKTSGKPIATIVQWANRPETTLGWSPKGRFTQECAVKGWRGDECTARGRYFTADFPGVLRDRIQANFGGELLYFNGAIGGDIAPGEADVWRVDDLNPLGDGISPPDDALAVGGADDLREPNFARVQTIGDQLAAATISLILEQGQPVDTDGPVWVEQSFGSGGEAGALDGGAAAEGGAVDGVPAEQRTGAQAAGEQVAVESDVETDSRLVLVDLGEVGLLFVPGDLSPEFVIGLPDDFATNSAAYYRQPELAAAAGVYSVPPPLLPQMGDRIGFTISLGGSSDHDGEASSSGWKPIAGLSAAVEAMFAQ